MYCSGCGAELAEGLSFCNRCGANLMPSETFISITKPKGALWIIALGIIIIAGIAIGGLGLLFAALMEFIRVGFPMTNVMLLAVFSILMLFGSVWIVSRQLSRLISLYLGTGEPTDEPKKSKLKTKLKAQSPAHIASPVQPMMSVTEHTTRTLDPIYREQDS